MQNISTLTKVGSKHLMTQTFLTHCMCRYFQKGIVIQKKENRPTPSGESQEFFTNQEFHPILYKQHEGQPFVELPSFNQAVDEFFSKMESQKLDLKVVQQVKNSFILKLWEPFRCIYK